MIKHLWGEAKFVGGTLLWLVAEVWCEATGATRQWWDNRDRTRT